MKILITGVAGFIGSHLADKLIKEGHEVFGIDDLSGGYKENINKKVTFYQFDIRDVQMLDYAFNEIRPQVIYHLASNAAENKAQYCPIDITSRNYDATIKVITSAIKYKVKRFIFTSSIAVYGEDQTPFDESMNPSPEDLYGVSKLASERSLQILSRVHGMEYVIARMHNVYGPRQNMSDPYRNVVTIWMNAILRDEPYYIYGNGKQVRCFTYIDDLVDGLSFMKRNSFPQGAYNIGSDQEVNLKELAKIIKKVTGTKRSVKKLPKRQQEVEEAVSNHYRMGALWGYCEMPIWLGIQNTWAWAKEMGPQELKYTDIELPTKKMPKNWL